ncbi:MAG TPA: DNA repair protein RecN [Anaeromyxobacter sp.]|nr:DNA repair protein RecN [Anaeromyxobacter sp.]
MLTTLRISGFAVVDAVEVQFGPGLNVLTGETGAGKSILVNALHLVLGGRMSAEVLREGAEEAVVEALFELPEGHPAFARLGLDGVLGPELLVRRVVSRGGRGRAFVNGTLCTVSMLEAGLRGLVDISGQHEHVSLLDPGVHLQLLDSFLGQLRGGEEALLSARYRAAYAALAALVRERDALAAKAEERARRAEYLGYQLRELEACGARPGELSELEGERRVLLSAERLKAAARGAEGLAYGEEGSAAERAGQAVRSLCEVATLDPRLSGPLGLLRSAAVELEEAGRELGRYAEAVGGDAERLAAVDDRLEGLRALSRKHGGSLEAALSRRDAMREELQGIGGGDERLAELSGRIAPLEEEVLALAGELSRARAEAARHFAAAVEVELGDLAMGRCRIEVALPSPEEGIEVSGRRLSPGGAERAEIRIAPNPGEPARPLAKIASGGELSRMLLAVKRVLARCDPVATYVFDEVDAGIGGAVAESMGRALADVSRGRQVLCVTHLPQVAAFADRHHLVEKVVYAGRTKVKVLPLEEEESRRREVARMMAGLTVTPSALEHAGSLIAAARLPRAARGARRCAPARSAARLASSPGAAPARGRRALGKAGDPVADGRRD